MLTLANEITALGDEWRHRQAANRMLDALTILVDDYGLSTTGPWAIAKTAFHGGGIIGKRYQTATAAIRAARRYSAGDCQCGCAGVLPTAEIDNLPSMAADPHYSSLVN